MGDLLELFEFAWGMFFFIVHWLLTPTIWAGVWYWYAVAAEILAIVVFAFVATVKTPDEPRLKGATGFSVIGLFTAAGLNFFLNYAVVAYRIFSQG